LPPEKAQGKSSRIGPAFAEAQGKTGLIPFLTAGYPSLDATLEMARGLATLGVRAIEIGIPFSDPIADGPDIQRASEWALRERGGAEAALEVVRALRRDSEVPVVLMTYANPVLRRGADRFAAEAREAGVDGVIVSDVPPDESPELWTTFDREGIDTVMLVAPTTDEARLPLLLDRSRGFVYCLSRTGVTGQGPGERGDLPARLAALRARTRLPIAVGFGVSTAHDARALRGVADAVIVGAAFMRAIAEDPAKGACDRVLALGRGLSQAVA
jgi:tryptophan synthase alpha chain